MKENFARRFSLILFFVASMLFSDAKPLTQFYLSAAEAAPGEEACLEIRATDFRDLQALSLGIRWDTSALLLESYRGLALDIPDDSFHAPADEPGLLLMTWTAIPPATLPDSSALVELCFTVKEPTTPHLAFVAFDDTRFPLEVIAASGWSGNPYVDARFYPGGVQITAPDHDLRLAARVAHYDDCGTPQTAVDLTIAGGQPPYSIQWTGPAGFSSTDKDLFSIPEGIYNVAVTDQLDRRVTGRVYLNIIENESDGLPMIEEVSVIPTDCSQRNGQIELIMREDASNYHFVWSNGSEGSAIANLASGDYTVTITNAAGCEQTHTFPVAGFGPIPYTRLLNDIPCDGTPAEIGVALENPHFFSFTWEDGDERPVRPVSRPGFYHLFIMNGANCSQEVTFPVEVDPSSLELDRLEADISCQDGLATIGIPEAPPELDYAWVHDGARTPLNTVEATGVYFLEVSNLNLEGCAKTLSFEVDPGKIATLERRIQDTLRCDLPPATIGFETIEGEQLQFSWQTGEETPAIDVTEAGRYKVTVTSGSFCEDSTAFEVTEAPFSFDLDRINGALGCGRPRDTIGLVLPEDTAGLTFFWPHSSETTPSVVVDLPNFYEVEVARGACTENYRLNATQTNTPLAVSLLPTEFTCSDTVKTIGVANPDTVAYDFRWQNGAVTPTIDVYQTGAYRLTVTESPVCTSEVIIRLDPSAQLDFQTIYGMLSCTMPSTTIGITPQDQDSIPYSYRWDTGDSTATIPVETPGYHTVEIQKGSFCALTHRIFVGTEPESHLFERIQEELSCFDSVATIGVRYPDTLDLDFNWNTGDTANLIQVSDPGDYYVMIDGGPACRQDFLFNLRDPVEKLRHQRMEAPLSCENPTATIGVQMVYISDYTFQWENGLQERLREVTQSGTYELTITDTESGCATTARFEVTPGRLELPHIEFICPPEGDCGNVAIRTTAEDGQAPYTYAWSTGQVDTGLSSTVLVWDLTPLDLVITDANGCMVEVENIEPSCGHNDQNNIRLRLYLTCEPGETQEAPMHPVLNGEVLSGGVPPYIFHWNTGLRDTSYFLSSFPYDENQGYYEVTVTDALGATAWWFVQSTELYGCGEENNTVHFEAPHVVVPPGSAFVYPIKVYDYRNLARSVFTIDWDNCLLQVDSIVQLYPERYSFPTETLNWGTSEVGFMDPGDSSLPDTATVMEVYFRAPENAEGISPFLFSINEPGSYRDGSTAFLRPHHGSITVAGQRAMVLPGDSDTDRRVDHFDLLNLGLFYSLTGPDRRQGSVDREEFGYPWRYRTPSSGVNIKHLDCNGDGLINYLDTAVIAQNWDLSSQTSRENATGEGPELIVETDTILPGTSQSFPILLGKESVEVQEGYGLAFTVVYDNRVIIPESVSADFAGSWLRSSSPLVISRNDPERSRIHLAIVRTNGQNASGFGEAARLHFQSWTTTEATAAEFRIENVRLINAAEETLPVDGRTTLAPLEGVTALDAPPLENFVGLYPIPATGWLRIAYPAHLGPERIEIIDFAGRRLMAREWQTDDLDISALPAGSYVLRLITKQGAITKQWIKAAE